MNDRPHVLVTGAGGFIGHHLVTFLKRRGYWVRGADLKVPEYSVSDADEFHVADLRNPDDALRVAHGVQEIYALAADMGGMGYITTHHAKILHDNSLINLNTINAAREMGVIRYLYTSSACIYPEYLQEHAEVRPLKEDDAYPAMPQDAYGWEKLVAERLAMHYREDYGLQTRIVRFHNIFGPLGTWAGGREKVPAALCRKIAVAKLTGESSIEIWGDGEQTRSFCYIDDCVEGIYRIMRSDFVDPLNLGQDRMISINGLADLIAELAGVDVDKTHIDGPQGVRGRNSDNSLLRRVLAWEPQITLEEGLARTYPWIEDQVRASLRNMQGRRPRSSKTLMGAAETHPGVTPSAMVNGVRIDAVTSAELAERVCALAAGGDSHVVHFFAAHPTVLARRDTAYREILNRGTINVADGAAVAAAARLFGAPTVRVSGADALPEICRRGIPASLNHFLWGSTPEVLTDLRSALERSFPGISIVGAESPPFKTLSEADYEAASARMRATEADVVWVGLGTPKQDIAAESLRQAGAAPVILSVGAAFDFMSGHKRRAPAWLQRAGCEWVFRLASEPRRLWRRYLIGNSQFIIGVGRDYFGHCAPRGNRRRARTPESAA